MTDDRPTDNPMRPARIAAVLTWVYAAGFGIPAIPVAGIAFDAAQPEPP